ncbi:MAG: hypothetical protein OEZ10_14095 [Gammaproteobacteria bacterium]|nr:hypothetical protein [Gammaproteobacteria bacterium]
MKYKLLINNLIWASLLIVLFGIPVLIQTSYASHPANIEEHTATVTVWQELVSGKVRYHYNVIDKSDKASITSVKLGYDYFHGIPLLKTDPENIYSPQGWKGVIVRTEETLEFEIEWAREDRAYNIQPGQQQTGFIVELPIADNIYRNTYFTVYFSDSTIASTHITPVSAPPPGDTMPPVLTVSLKNDRTIVTGA